jgi:hypothetical protein
MNLDKTFCASPQCKNDCGVKFTDEVKRAADIMRPNYGVSLAYFCGKPEQSIKDEK